MRYDPITYRATWGKASSSLMFWVILLVGLMVYGGIGTALTVADPGPGFGERHRHSRVATCATPEAVADWGRS
jgi:hypothetical protein